MKTTIHKGDNVIDCDNVSDADDNMQPCHSINSYRCHTNSGDDDIDADAVMML